jgi:hypothetical protein
MPPTVTIPLHAGWNWVGYLPSAPLPITTALASIAGSYVRVVGDRGSYQPDWDATPWFITLPDMRPGEGYLIRTTQAVTLTYPSNVMSQSEQPAGPRSASSCPTVVRTPFLSLAYGTVMVGEALAPVGAVVEAITLRGEVAGCAQVTTPGYFGAMALYGEDISASSRIPGFRSGEPITFRVNGRSTSAEPALHWQNDLETHRIVLRSVDHRTYLPTIVRER